MPTTSSSIRLENFRELIKKAGGPAEAARKLDMDDSQLSQIGGKHPTRNIGTSLARRIEQAFRKPEGWLDMPHAQLAALQLLTEVPLTPAQRSALGRRVGRALVNSGIQNRADGQKRTAARKYLQALGFFRGARLSALKNLAMLAIPRLESLLACHSNNLRRSR